jgi:hypothetical protein
MSQADHSRARGLGGFPPETPTADCEAVSATREQKHVFSGDHPAVRRRDAGSVEPRSVRANGLDLDLTTQSSQSLIGPQALTRCPRRAAVFMKGSPPPSGGRQFRFTRLRRRRAQRRGDSAAAGDAAARDHHTQGSGACRRPASAAVRVSGPALIPPLRTRWSRSHSPHAFLSGTSRLQFSIRLRGLGPGMACRRRALEPVDRLAVANKSP